MCVQCVHMQKSTPWKFSFFTITKRITLPTKLLCRWSTLTSELHTTPIRRLVQKLTFPRPAHAIWSHLSVTFHPVTEHVLHFPALVPLCSGTRANKTITMGKRRSRQRGTSQRERRSADYTSTVLLSGSTGARGSRSNFKGRADAHF